MHIKNAQPIEEIGAESPCGHLGRQIAVRRGDQVDIGLECRCPARGALKKGQLTGPETGLQAIERDRKSLENRASPDGANPIWMSSPP